MLVDMKFQENPFNHVRVACGQTDMTGSDKHVLLRVVYSFPKPQNLQNVVLFGTFGRYLNGDMRNHEAWYVSFKHGNYPGPE